MKNYRPVSNLTFVSKLVERIVSEQLIQYLNDGQLMPPLQSAYRRCHSTETALLRVLSDIFAAADRQRVTLLGLLDLSAAFDCVDHALLLNRLQQGFGIDGTALRWLTSFLSDRTQVIAYNGCTSAIIQLKYGVPKDQFSAHFCTYCTLLNCSTSFTSVVWRLTATLMTHRSTLAHPYLTYQLQ